MSKRSSSQNSHSKRQYPKLKGKGILAINVPKSIIKEVLPGGSN